MGTIYSIAVLENREVATRDTVNNISDHLISNIDNLSLGSINSCNDTFTETSQTRNYQLVALIKLDGSTEMFVDINDCLSVISDTNN